MTNSSKNLDFFYSQCYSLTGSNVWKCKQQGGGTLLLLVFFVFWIIISAHLDLEVVIFGAVISTIVYLFVRSQMHHKPISFKRFTFNILCGFKYAGILVWETAKASVAVLRIVFSRSINIKPRLIFFKPGINTETARVVLANSITLTPGTITAEIHDGVFCIHCLDEGLDDGIGDSVFIKMLRRFEE